MISPGSVNIGFIQSTNKGTSWTSKPIFATDIQVVGVVTPDTGQPIRDASILYAVSVDPKSMPPAGRYPSRRGSG